MIQVSIIGTGNVAWHLAQVFSASTSIQLNQVYGRSDKNASFFTDYEFVSEIKKLHEVDYIFIAVSDNSITTISEKISKNLGTILHTSGSTPIEVLKKHDNYGVFYPLQTFTLGRTVDFAKIPICIEANNENTKKQLYNLASLVSDTVHEMNSNQRKYLHLAAVMSNNFINHLLAEAKKLCKQEQIPYKMLKSLCEETVSKAFDLNPDQAQTGPARRGGYEVISKHLELLNDESQKNIYKTLSNSILQKYGKEKL